MAPSCLGRSVAARALLVAACFTLSSLGTSCGSEPKVAVQASAEPSTATLDIDGIVRAKLMPPQGEWKLREVEVENAKIVSRDGDAPLELSMRRSQAEQGETTVEGADEPIAVSVTYADRRAGTTAVVVYRIETPANAKEGASLPVNVTW